MRILTDETVARSTVKMLREAEHDVVDVKEAGLAGSTDSHVAALAREQRRVIVTHDKHFGDILRLEAFKHIGAIVLRLKDVSPESTNSALARFLSLTNDNYAVGKVVILSERGYRARDIDTSD
jgi:predicted nuclease of predicted toxin-antitoxin system